MVAEINHIQKKSESQTKDMKKMMKDNAQTLLEFERALARKSGECNVSHPLWLNDQLFDNCFSAGTVFQVTRAGKRTSAVERK